jgi:putative ABC transport system permease protein
MFKNYLKIAFRNLWKNKVYSTINIAGLAVGMAVALIIGLWTAREFSYNKFLPKYERIYQVETNYTTKKEGTSTSEVAAIPLLEVFQKEVPGIKSAVLCDWINDHSLMVGDKKIVQRGVQISPDFLTMFEYPMIKGDPVNALKETYSIVLCESVAKALFGDEDPMGKMVRVDNANNLMVTGVLKDIPSNSSLQFSYVLPFQYFIESTPYVKASVAKWDSQFNRLFIELEPEVSREQMTIKIKNLICLKNPRTCPYSPELFLHPLKDWNLYSKFENGKVAGGYIDYVVMFSIIGLLVLIIACINFMNLSTARSSKRAKEVGVRKAIGSQRKQLIFQFLIESVLLAFVSFLLCLTIVQVCIPSFNKLANSEIHLPLKSFYFWLLMFGYILLTGILAGSRPAFFLSGFQPARVLKGTIQSTKSAALSKKILVVIQFSCSIGLIISTFIIYQQIQYAQQRDKGYDSNRLLITWAGDDLLKNYDVLKNDLIQSGFIEAVGRASSSLDNIDNITYLNSWSGKKASEEGLSMGIIRVSPDYFTTVGMDLVLGKDLQSVSPEDTLSVVVNEAFVREARIEQPLNTTIDYDNGLKGKIIGVVKNALMRSPYDPAFPITFTLRPNVYNTPRCIFYRLPSKTDTKEAIAHISTIFSKYNPAYPYDYRFVDDLYMQKFELESLVGKLSGIFAGLAIFISCLGLFGLAAYTTEQRTKEIGVRKVLGASVAQLWMLLCKDFMFLILISSIIASPLVYYFLQNWLEKYQYHISIGVDVFILSALIAFLITIITISFQAIKAAFANPVKNLRTE